MHGLLSCSFVPTKSIFPALILLAWDLLSIASFEEEQELAIHSDYFA